MPHPESIDLASSTQIFDFKFNNEQDVQDVVAAAADICAARFSSISILKDQYQYNFYSRGFHTDIIHKDFSICAALQQEDDLVIIENLQNIKQVPNRSLGDSFPEICFYAGLPFRNENLELIGYLCVYHDKPLKISAVQRSLLIALVQQLPKLFSPEKEALHIEDKPIDVKQQYIRREPLFNSSQMVTLLLDKNFAVLECHPLLAELIYKNLQRLIKIGDDIRDFVGDLTKSDFTKNFNRALDGQNISVHTMSGLCWGGLSSFCHFSPAYDSEGELIGVYFHALPIFPEPKYDPDLDRKDRDLQWINDLQSHRFRGPLASILGITQIWKELGNPPSKEEVEMIIQAAKKLDREIQNVLCGLPTKNAI